MKPHPRDKDIDIFLYHPKMPVGALQDIVAIDACFPGPGSGWGSLASSCSTQSGIEIIDVTISNQNAFKYLGNVTLKTIAPGKSKITITAKHAFKTEVKTFDIEAFTPNRFVLTGYGQGQQQVPLVCNSNILLAGDTIYMDYKLWANDIELGGYELYPLTTNNVQIMPLRERMSFYEYDKWIYLSDHLTSVTGASSTYRETRDRLKVKLGPASGPATIINSFTGETLLRTTVVQSSEITDLNLRYKNSVGAGAATASIYFDAMVNGVPVCAPSVEFPGYEVEIFTPESCTLSRKGVKTKSPVRYHYVVFDPIKPGLCKVRISVQNSKVFKDASITVTK